MPPKLPWVDKQREASEPNEDTSPHISYILSKLGVENG